MNLKSAFAAAALIGLAGAAHAQMMSGMRSMTNGRAYAELGYTQLDIRGSSGGVGFDANPGMLRGIVGYDLHPNLGVEGLLGLGIRDDDIGGAGFTGNIDLRHTFGLFVRPKVQLGPVELFARAGWARTRVKSSVTAGGATTSIEDSESDGAYGAGVNWQFSPRAYAGLDVMRYYDRGGTKADGVTLSVGTRW